MSLRNNLISGGEGKGVAHAAKLRVIDNAVLSDSSRSKDSHMSQRTPQSPGCAAFINSTHDSINSFAVKMNLICQIVVVMILNNN